MYCLRFLWEVLSASSSRLPAPLPPVHPAPSCSPCHPLGLEPVSLWLRVAPRAALLRDRQECNEAIWRPDCRHSPAWRKTWSRNYAVGLVCIRCLDERILWRDTKSRRGHRCASVSHFFSAFAAQLSSAQSHTVRGERERQTEGGRWRYQDTEDREK